VSRKRQEQRREQQRQQRQRELAQRKKSEMVNPASAASWQPNAIRITRAPAHAPARKPPAPTFSECVIGYREWLVDAAGQLRAITMTRQIWNPGVNTARCRPNDHVSSFYFQSLTAPEAHPAPADGCHCGLYGWNDIREPTSRCDDLGADGRLWAFGAIAAWGDLQVHESGFRASHACIVALAHNDATTPRVRAVLDRIGAEYRVPVVHGDALQAEAERHGTPLPDDVRPHRDPVYISPASLLRNTPMMMSPGMQIYVSSNASPFFWTGP
jgi:hypothetical protein